MRVVKTRNGRQVSLFAAVTLVSLMTAGTSRAADKKPNILVIMGDDIGLWNISAYSRGMTGYRTPNIDRIAKEGAIFTDWYGHPTGPSCTRQGGDPTRHTELFRRFSGHDNRR